MPILDIRRHAEAATEGSAVGALSDRGLAMAQSLARNAPAYSRVVASPRPRTQATATAIAGGCDEVEQAIDVAPDSVITIQEYFSLRTADAVAAFVADRAAARAFVAAQFAVWIQVISQLLEHQVALIVGHGANVELPAVMLALELGERPPHLPVGYLEGIRVRYERGGPRDLELLTATPPGVNG